MVEPIRDDGFDGCSAPAREHAIGQLAALASAVSAEALAVIAAADRAEDWRADGCLDMAGWLVLRQKVSRSTAYGWVRVARALEGLPRLRGLYAAGVVSYDQVFELTRFATPDLDEWLAALAPTLSARECEQMAKQRRVRRPTDAAAVERERRLRVTPHRSGDGWAIHGFVGNEAGALIAGRIAARADRIGRDTPPLERPTWLQRNADALTDMARADHAADPNADPALVVVHVDDDVLHGDAPGNATIDDQPVPVETAQRLGCDGLVETQVHGPDGTCVGVSRARRTPPAWLRRAIAHRDRTCRFPGCEGPVRHVHHMTHWSRGGPTDAPNLLSVCWDHHHLLHEGGWHATGDADRTVTFTGPDGRTLSDRPPPLDRDVRRRIHDLDPHLPEHDGDGDPPH